MGNNIILDTKQMIDSMHNDIQCLSLESATRPCDRCWFTSKQIQEWSGMTRKTLDRRLEKLISVGRIVGMKELTNNIIDVGTNKELEPSNGDILQGDSLGTNLSLVGNPIKSDIIDIGTNKEIGSLNDNILQGDSTSNKFVTSGNSNKNNSDIIELNLPHKTGSKVTKLYNLNVLNQLAMIEYENEKLNAISSKFSDILSEVETTGSYGLQLDEHDLLLLNIYKAKTDTERALAVSKLDEYHEREKRDLEDKTAALESENEDLKNTNDELLTENELWRGNYFNTKQIYEILERDYPESLKQAESTNYNNLRKGLCDITNEKRQGRKVYKKHVKNDKGETEWRQEYYFERGILDTILERVRDSINYIFNIRLR